MKRYYRFAIVTPVKDEIKFFPRTVESVVNQGVLPDKWVIVDDGSTDGTTDYIKEIEKKFSWITVIYLPESTHRKEGGEFVLHKAMKFIALDNLDYLVRLDGDVQFDKDYFNELFSRMSADLLTGIAGGVSYIYKKGELVEERNPKFHVRGNFKTYKIKCLKDIGGFNSDLGWDTIDEIKAYMMGWKTISYPDLKTIHLKPTRGSSNWYKAREIDGRSAYNSGYHPVFFVARAMRHLFRNPPVIGSMAMIWAFVKNYISRRPRGIDDEYIRFIRKHQINRLLGKTTIWK